MKVQIADTAIEDLRELLNYYQEQLVPEVGQRIAKEILDRSETLAGNPEIGRIVPEFGADSIRELIQKPFRIVYLVEPSTISIVRIWRSERLLELP